MRTSDTELFYVKAGSIPVGESVCQVFNHFLVLFLNILFILEIHQYKKRPVFNS